MIVKELLYEYIQRLIKLFKEPKVQASADLPEMQEIFYKLKRLLKEDQIQFDLAGIKS